MSESCKNHPHIPGARRCFHCKKHICPECTIREYHHLFCSKKCIALFKLNETYEKVQRLLGLKSNKRKKSARVRTAHVSGIVLSLLIIINIVLIIALSRIVERTEDKNSELAGRINNLSTLIKEYKDIPIYNPELTPVITDSIGSITEEKLLSISGNSGKNYVIALFINDELDKIVQPESGKFELNNILLNPGENHIVVYAFGKNDSRITLKDFQIKYTNTEMETLSRDFTRGRTNSSYICLTFDGGAESNNASQILNILKDKNVKSTFFLTGRFIKRNPEFVKRMIDDGHEIGNHTYNHKHLTTYEQNLRHDTSSEITYEVLKSELIRSDSVYTEITGGHLSGLWRSPYGEQNSTIRMWAAEQGYRHIGWTRGGKIDGNMDSYDWVSDKDSPLYRTSEEIKENLLNFGNDSGNGAGGSIILMHLGSNRQEDYIYEQLPDIIDGFRGMGYEFCMVSELITSEDQADR